MKKKLLLASAFVSLLGATAQAQTPFATDRKWNSAVEHIFQQEQNDLLNGLKSTATSAIKGFIISCTDAETVVEAITSEGYEANIISETVVTAKIPTSFVKQLAEMDEVIYINGARKFMPTMNDCREVTGVNKIHNAINLETPFTGKGVVVGVIDQGFEYRHIAFSDKEGKTRVRGVWNHYKGSSPVSIPPSTSDGIKNAYGHATHVTNIAAGAKVEGNDYYGIAPDADIIMVPSDFLDFNVLEEAKYIKEYAQKEGKPFVINMSFGSQIGPHDGSDSYCQGMNEIAKEGGVLVAAMGNEGEMKLHVHHAFTKENEKIRIISEDPSFGNIYMDLWGQNADGKQHLKVTPVIFNNNNKKIDPKDSQFWRSCLEQSGNIDPHNQKENYSFKLNVQTMRNQLMGGSFYFFGVEIEGNPGDEFHAWFNPGWGSVKKVFGQGYAKGDNEYCVGEGAASIPHAVAVASFNANDGTYTSAIDGRIYSLGGREGEISSFSSRGPSLGTEPKPLVAAPGHVVSSAVCQFGDFNPNDIGIVSVIKKGGKKYFYQVMSGTSMASPAVAGIVALWLQANPELTYTEVKQIIEETSTLDEGTGTKNEWDNKRGFGKIDAYAGLKKALQMAEETGINDQLNSEVPISIQHSNEQINVLFNNDESFAQIALYNASGVEVSNELLNNVRRGNETVITTAGLPAGVYVVRITTTASTTAKKLLVK